jgi:hypothetical protein
MRSGFCCISTAFRRRCNRGECATGQTLPSVRCRDFGYLAWCDGCCDDTEDFLMEVLGGES